MSGLTFSGDIVVYIIGLAASWGAIMWRLSSLEKRVEKHNNMIERTYILEGKVSEIEGDIKELKGAIK